MTKEEKDLVYKDICARLPYDVIVHINDVSLREHDTILYEETLARFGNNQAIIRPYLRSLSSMTEEERKDIGKIVTTVYGGKVVDDDFVNVIKYIDWLNEHHFDYRGLIEKELAIEASRENNPYK